MTLASSFFPVWRKASRDATLRHCHALARLVIAFLIERAREESRILFVFELMRERKDLKVRRIWSSFSSSLTLWVVNIMSIIVFFYSLLSIYSQLACKHLSVRFCPTSSDNSTTLSDGSGTESTLGWFNATLSSTTTATTVATLSVVVGDVGPAVRLGLDDVDDFPVVEVTQLWSRERFNDSLSKNENR